MGEMLDYYSSWSENDLRNAIWQLSNGMSIKGPYADIELLRSELKRRGLSDEGHHEENKASYYAAAFKKLIIAGVPRWYIRLYLLTEIIYWSRVYVYYNPYDIEAHEGWYATNGISLTATEADRNRKCYGDLENMGFPDWEAYKILFDGTEYDQRHEFMNAYGRHKEEWLQERARERHINYAD